MEYRRLGKSGLQLSALSYGSWVTFGTQIETKGAERLLGVAYEMGVNFFDNAEAYADGESEKIMGQALKNLNWRRDSYCVSSKVFWGGRLPTQRGLSRKHVTDGCHQALKRLQVDYLDLYFCHRPDFHTPIEETVRAMDALVQQGKILYWGTSEWTAQQIMEAYSVSRELGLTPPTMEQPQYNLFYRDKIEREYHDLYETVGLGTTIWSPLASGVLTGKYRNGIPDDSRMNLKGYEWLKAILQSDEGKSNLAKANQFEDLAKELGTTLPKFAIAWCLKNPRVSTVILGASKEDQLKENLESFEIAEKLTPEVLDRVEAIAQNRPSLPQDYLLA